MKAPKTRKLATAARKAARKAAKPYSASRTRYHKLPDTTTSILTVTSKMPGPSFSLPAGLACPNSWGGVCGKCYAKGGCYGYSNVQAAQLARFHWAIECMRSPKGQQTFIDQVIRAIQYSRAPYFRGHDSGDFFNVAYVESWIRICEALPNVRFWFPTREYQVKPATNNPLAVFQPNPRMDAIRRLAALPNVTVRPSALAIGADAPVVPGLAAGSCVGNPNVKQCPASQQNGECRDCRTCWDAPDVAVSYPLH